MGDTYVTFQGWVGGDVNHKTVSGVSVANIRVASTPRIKRKGEWMDGATTWYSVSAWRALADNISESVKKGDAVIVHGRLRSDEWKREDGQLSTTLLVEASYVGHDLCRGTSTFTRSVKQDRTEGDIHEVVADMIHQNADVTAQIDSWGDPVPAPSEAGAGDTDGDGLRRSEDPAA